MKVKYICKNEGEDFENAVNEFIKGKRIRDIKFVDCDTEDAEFISALIMYEDGFWYQPLKECEI